MKQTMAALDGLLARLLRTESLAVIAALVLVALGYINSIEEAVAIAGTVSSLVLGRSGAKMIEARNVVP